MTLEKKANLKNININLVILESILICIFAIQFICVESSANEEYATTLRMVVPHINVQDNFLIKIQFILTSFIIVFSIIKNKFKFKYDYFSIFLIIRLIIGAFQISINEFDQNYTLNIGNYLFYLLEFFLYSSFLQYSDKSSYIKLMKFNILLIGFVTSIQTIYQSLKGVLPFLQYDNVVYKASLHIPIGSSNLLAVLILPGLIAEIFMKKEYKFFTLFNISVNLLALFLTKSRFGILIFLSSFFIKIFLNTSKNKSVFIKKIIIICLLLGLSIYIINSYSDQILRVLLGYSSLVNSGSVMNKITSGRTENFSYFLNKFLQRPVFGNGPNYEFSRAHNIFIDVLYQNGLFGFYFFTQSILYTIKKCKRILNENDYNMYFFVIVFVLMLVESLAEISFFTSFMADILFFSSIAIINKE